mmetsp:Transcript_10681/g.18721  ORF Transcript_10681/g.18721 Transcript_10681/m.18721 type:complete len:290 (-) Transcript_10681:126-995(-)
MKSFVGRCVGPYMITDYLGRGGNATVWKAVHRATSVTVAIKAVLKESADMFHSEIFMMQHIHSSRILTLHEIVRLDNSLFIVLEYCPGKDLAQTIKQKGKVTEEFARHIIQEVAIGLRALHARRIAHRDLKSENLLLSDDSDRPIVKIADFGLATCIRGKGIYTPCGTPAYTAPEVLSGAMYDATADLWSLGIVLFEMLFGHVPFAGKDHVQVLQSIRATQEICLPLQPRPSADALHLLKSLLQRDPRDRISFHGFFRHPFVRQDGLKGWLNTLPYFLPPIAPEALVCA